MDRRYYLAKLFLIVVAVGLALAGGSFGPRMAHAIGTQTQHSAPAQVQDAAWHATASAVRLAACLASRALHSMADIAP
jgi:hypothetical protein